MHYKYQFKNHHSPSGRWTFPAISLFLSGHPKESKTLALRKWGATGAATNHRIGESLMTEKAKMLCRLCRLRSTTMLFHIVPCFFWTIVWTCMYFSPMVWDDRDGGCANSKLRPKNVLHCPAKLHQGAGSRNASKSKMGAACLGFHPWSIFVAGGYGLVVHLRLI